MEDNETGPRWATCTVCGKPGALCQGVSRSGMTVVQAERCGEHFARGVAGRDSAAQPWRCGTNGLWRRVASVAPRSPGDAHSGADLAILAAVG